MKKTSASHLFAFASVLLMGGTLTASAQARAPNYYAGKTVRMISCSGPGGGFDLGAATVARHIGKHLAGNPTVVSESRPGAGSFAAAAHIYTAAPKDGTVMGIIARDAPLGTLTGQEGARC